MLDELITFQKRALEKLRNHCAAALNEYKNSRENQVVSFTAPKQTRDWYLFRPNNPGYDRYQSPCRTASSQCGLDEFRRSQGQIQ